MDIVKIQSPRSISIYFLVLIPLSLLGGCSTPRQPAPASFGTAATAHSEVVMIARRLVGTPYHYGGRSPKQGFDCSGLVYYANLRAGIRLPRTSYGQYKATQPVALRNLHPGDLVFFRLNRHRVSHVGIYIGHHQFIHAPARGKEVTIEDINDPYWRHRFVRGGRTL